MTEPKTQPTILCLDDEPDLLYLHRVVLERAGYSVLSASEAGEALRLLSENPVQLVITDHLMPGGRSSEEFIVEMKRLRPSVPVLLLTGMPDIAESSADAVMQKMEGAEELLRVVKEMLR